MFRRIIMSSEHGINDDVVPAVPIEVSAIEGKFHISLQLAITAVDLDI